MLADVYGSYQEANFKPRLLGMSPGHAEESHSSVVGFWFRDNPVVLLVNVSVGRLDAGMLIRPIWLVVCCEA